MAGLPLKADVDQRSCDVAHVPKPAVSRCSNMPCAEGRVIPAAGTSDYCGSLCSGRRLLRRPYGFIPLYLLFERVVFAKRFPLARETLNNRPGTDATAPARL